MINVHDKFFAYHGDIVHYLSVDLYSTEPPEESLMALAFLSKDHHNFSKITV